MVNEMIAHRMKKNRSLNLAYLWNNGEKWRFP